MLRPQNGPARSGVPCNSIERRWCLFDQKMRQSGLPCQLLTRPKWSQWQSQSSPYLCPPSSLLCGTCQLWVFQLTMLRVQMSIFISHNKYQHFFIEASDRNRLFYPYIGKFRVKCVSVIQFIYVLYASHWNCFASPNRTFNADFVATPLMRNDEKRNGTAKWRGNRLKGNKEVNWLSFIVVIRLNEGTDKWHVFLRDSRVPTLLPCSFPFLYEK